nr:hypothetical protein [uncultured Sphingosinicella sp.]
MSRSRKPCWLLLGGTLLISGCDFRNHVAGICQETGSAVPIGVRIDRTLDELILYENIEWPVDEAGKRISRDEFKKRFPDCCWFVDGTFGERTLYQRLYGRWSHTVEVRHDYTDPHAQRSLNLNTAYVAQTSCGRNFEIFTEAG